VYDQETEEGEDQVHWFYRFLIEGKAASKEKLSRTFWPTHVPFSLYSIELRMHVTKDKYSTVGDEVWDRTAVPHR